MGRKQSRLSGLSSFVKDAFETPGNVSDVTELFTPTAIAGKNRKASEVDDDQHASSRPTKKRKVGLLGEGSEAYDATGLVPHYTDPSEVPDHLRKYFFQRERYFSLYSEGCLLDEEGWYSVTPELIADQIAERCRCDTILDAFCGVGGNAIAFAKTCERVIALDTSPIRLSLARHNAMIYGVADRIEFILADYISFAKSYLSMPNKDTRKIDVVFLSPPWGGPEYLDGTAKTSQAIPSSSEDEHPEYSLSSIRPIHGEELFRLTQQITPNIAYFLPRNTNLDEISQLAVRKFRKRRGKGKERRLRMNKWWKWKKSGWDQNSKHLRAIMAD
ncbi:hypothetical protein QCA50_010518 [Cerrena zonata]|uniref:Trimethylguanosine synthase n=1 Tax=Cerrena zonata TaxID=2478898 RepID=A0AAW0G3M1_9APHY